MSEEKTEKKQSETVEDKVEREDYNKIVENANSLKADKEALEKKLQEKEEEEKVVKTNEEKETWLKEKADMQKQMEDLKKKAEKVEDNEKVAKGKVATKEAQQPEEAKTKDDIKAQIDDQLGKDDDFDPKKCASAIARYAHYKNPTTRKYTDEQLGKGLSLHAGAQVADNKLVDGFAKKNADDIIV